MEEEHHKIITTADSLIHILFEFCDNTITSFKNMVLAGKPDADLNQKILDKVYEEYLVLYCYYLIDVLKQMLSVEEQQTAIKGTLERVAIKLMDRNAARGGVIDDNDCVIKFFKLFDERNNKYKSYKYFLFVRKDGAPVEESIDNAVRYFSEEIAKIIKMENLVAPIDHLTIRYLDAYQRELESKGISVRIKYANDRKVITTPLRS